MTVRSSTCLERTPCRRVADWTGSTRAGEVTDWFVRTPLRILLIVLSAALLSMVVRRVIRRSLEGINRVGLAPERVRARSSTLGDVLRSAAVGAIWTLAILTILPELGVNLGAFVVGATVVGGALAFGAQQLVRDVLAGLFVLGEDQYGVGDTIDVGFIEGVVERVTLRSVQIRDVAGQIWHVPHGNVSRVANLSHGPGRVVLDVRLQRGFPPADALRRVAELCETVSSDPGISADVHEAPAVLGVQAVSDDHYVVRAVVGVRPAQRSELQRRLFRAVVEAGLDGSLPPPPTPPVETTA